MILLAFIVVLAVCGLIYAVVAGTAFMQRSMQRHVHLLYKRALAKDFLVKDLAPGAVDPFGNGLDGHGCVGVGDDRDRAEIGVQGLGMGNRGDGSEPLAPMPLRSSSSSSSSSMAPISDYQYRQLAGIGLA